MSLFPEFPPGDPGVWPELMLGAATVLLEAEGEPELGKLAVAWVIRNRMDRQKISLRAVILGKDEVAQGDSKPFEAFSCFNDDYVGIRTSRLANPDPSMVEICWRAACSAYWRLVPDPTHGATFYLNEALTIQSRPDHKLPTWFKKENVRCRIGNHTFLL